MENRPEFTREQEEWICSIISQWYLMWKDKIGLPERPYNTYRFEMAQKDLKEWICSEERG